MATAPDPAGAADETPGQRFRVESDMWQVFGTVCGRLGVGRAQSLIGFMRREVHRHGTAEERARFDTAEQKMRARRSRRPKAG